ncbi:MAG: hypothetical protein H6696_01135 [Deferribacteres bacterium]|nr:hypothetical protein [candidate division KSB1 bacterium]MCB9500512.1 hypothetical protein [Deferribacteres bacterium]
MKFNILKRSVFTIIVLLLFVMPVSRAQQIESSLEKLMVNYEGKVIQVYQEMQALERSPKTHQERLAFDEVLSNYTIRVLEIYKTLTRIKTFTLENYKTIAARALFLKALANLDVADGDKAKLKSACEDYQQALALTRGAKTSVLSQSLPYEIWIGDRLYTKLAELLDDKDKDRVLLRCMNNSGN